jgi:trehalose-6-phosphate synthase
MELDERLDRHRKLLARVRRSDIVGWRKAFMDALRGHEQADHTP